LIHNFGFGWVEEGDVEGEFDEYGREEDDCGEGGGKDVADEGR
jgi:hypothetical protein